MDFCAKHAALPSADAFLYTLILQKQLQIPFNIYVTCHQHPVTPQYTALYCNPLYVRTYRSNDLKSKIESCAFHTAKDRVERFEAYSCRVELLEKSKLIRAQVT